MPISNKDGSNKVLNGNSEKKYLDGLFTKGMYGHDENVNILEFTSLCQTPLKELLAGEDSRAWHVLRKRTAPGCCHYSSRV